MIFGGIALLVLAVVFWFIGRSARNKLDAMNATDTYSSSMLTDLYQRVAGSLGADSLSEDCEIEGVIEADAPLKAPLSGTSCVHYTVRVSREYEEQQARTDAQGLVSTTTNKASEQVEENTQSIDFWVRDADGRTRVRLDGADLDLRQTKEEFRPAETAPASGGTVDFGFFKVKLSGHEAGRRTIGYRLSEQVLETGLHVYVMGCAADCDGAVAVMRHPSSKSGRFMVSRRSERELASSAASTAKNMLYAAGASGAIGLILVVVGLL